jgi:hypothetical protein
VAVYLGVRHPYGTHDEIFIDLWRTHILKDKHDIYGNNFRALNKLTINCNVSGILQKYAEKINMPKQKEKEEEQG